LRVVRVRGRERSGRGRHDERGDHRAEQRDPQPFHYLKVAGSMRIRTGAAASSGVASRYCVVTFGLTLNWNAPVVVIDRNCVHVVPSVDFCTTAAPTPRTTPESVTRVRGFTTGFGDGGCSERTPTLNHVERRPSADRTVSPPTVSVSCSPRESEVTLSVFTR